MIDRAQSAAGGGRGGRWRWIALGVLVVPALLGVFALLTMSSGPSETVGPVRGLRLGFAPSQARRALQVGVSGSFATEAMGEDYALQWTPDRAGGDLARARMEFHLGQLVAVRLSLTPEAPEAEGPPIQLSDASVLTRERTPDGVELTWLARSCPTHADEVRRRIADAR